MHKKKNDLLSIIEKIFWVIYIVVPIFTGVLAYNWLPNESPNEGIHEIIASHEECEPNNKCGEVADAWRNIETGRVYTPYDFEKHSKNEWYKVILKFVGYGLIGFVSYFSFEYFKKRALKNTSTKNLS